jgi:hypothetical protein
MMSSDKNKSATERAARITSRGVIIAALITAAGVVIAGMFGLFDGPKTPAVTVSSTLDPSKTLAVTSTELLTLVPSLTPTPQNRVCKPIASGQPFSVIANYDPSGQIGDLGDIPSVWKNSEIVHFEYETQGLGPHDQPAKFGGVMFLDPPNNWGTDPEGGYDLRSVRKSIHWEARSVEGAVNVEFLIGGVRWAWNEELKSKEKVPFPDTLPRTSLGVYSLTPEWQEFRYSLTAIKDNSFGCVVAGFGMMINWGSAGQNQKYGVEVRNIFYEN